ncbi:MAG: sensor histidine kinase [Terriglobales bacterium]
MDSLLWHLTNRTAETLLILNLFHLLLTGLAVMVLLHQRLHRGAIHRPERLVTLGFGVLGLHFAILTLRFAVAFFFGDPLRLAGLEGVSHALLIAGVVIIASAYLDAIKSRFGPLAVPAFLALIILELIELSRTALDLSIAKAHSWAMLAGDAIGFAVLLFAIAAIIRNAVEWPGRGFRLLGLASLAAVFVLHGAPSFLPHSYGVVVWNFQEHLMSLALFSLTWAVGERSPNLLDRVFVRLNLTFLILASLIMLSTAGMEKYQYFRLAEERSVSLAEFLRGHYIYYRGHGEDMQQIFDHPDVLRRVMAEFGTLPELREINVYAQGQRAAFRYMPNWEVKESITRADAPEPVPADAVLRNSFQMIRLPIDTDNKGDRVEFIGTLDYVNAYIGKYIIFIYCSFTVMLALGTVIIGIIVADTDRQLTRRYVELQEAQQQLAQSAKLASIGELAGGMAHEINNPITSILALASHMSEGDTAGTLPARSRKNLQIIVRQAERVANLVGGLLTFSRQTQMQINEVHVRELLDTAIELVQFRIGPAIQVRRDFDPSLPPVPGDASRLTEVFVNLLSNAIDAMPNGGTLRVGAQKTEDRCVRIEIQDTGEGIAAENLPRIFDPFFTTKAPGRGTGLGLSISHGIVKDHGGEIWANSEAGAGTTIVISLSAGVEQHEPAYSRN